MRTSNYRQIAWQTNFVLNNIAISAVRHGCKIKVSRHTWATFRDQLILEYEIPKWDGDLGQPNFYVPIPLEILQRKIRLLLAHFGTQASKDWFDEDVFRGLARLRGMECRAPERFAEAFFARKIILR